jgi:hypothetical protein
MSNVNDIRLELHNKNNNYTSSIIEDNSSGSSSSPIDLDFSNSTNYFRKIMDSKVTDDSGSGSTETGFEKLKKILNNFKDHRNTYRTQIQSFEPSTGGPDRTDGYSHNTIFKALYGQLHNDIGFYDYTTPSNSISNDAQCCQEFIFYISAKYYIISECLLRLLLDTQHNVTDGSDSAILSKYYNNYTEPYPNGIKNYNDIIGDRAERNPGIIDLVLGGSDGSMYYADIKQLLEDCVSGEISIFVNKFYGIDDVFENSIVAITQLQSLEEKKSDLIKNKNTFDDKVSFSNKKINYYNIHYWIALLLLILIVIGNVVSTLQGSNKFMMINLAVLILLLVRKFGQFIMKLFK